MSKKYPKFAQNTTVSAARSRLEIEETVNRYSGPNAEFTYGQGAGKAAIQFSMKGRRVRFTVNLPTIEEAKIGAKRKNGRIGPTEAQKNAWCESETRRLWRSLTLCIKAKLEAVSSNIGGDETFDREFLGYIVVNNGNTLYEELRHIDHGSEGGLKLLPALPGSTSA